MARPRRARSVGSGRGGSAKRHPSARAADRMDISHGQGLNASSVLECSDGRGRGQSRTPGCWKATWRRERDSNPRGLGGPCGFQERRLTCCSVPSSVVVVTNLSRSVVVECRRIPSRAVAVGVWMGVVAGAQAAPGRRPTTAHEQGALRQKRRAALRRIGGALRGPLPCLSCCARLCDQRTSAWELAHRLPDQLEPLRRRPARPG